MLKTDYKDDIPSTQQRKYQMIDNGDNTVSFNDVTTYTQEGDPFGAADINATNNAVNDNTSDIADINTALDGKADKVSTSTAEVSSTATSIQGIFEKIYSEIYASQILFMTKLQLQPNYYWTEDNKRRHVNFYEMEVESSNNNDDYVDENFNMLQYTNIVLRGALLGKSIELAFRIKSYVSSGFPNPETYPDIEVTYFKDSAGNDLSQDKRFIGDAGCNITVTYRT